MSSNVALADADAGGRGEPERPAAIPVICGPTGAGKSAVAMWLAERFPILIISADSRHVFRRFDIGTAKPGAEDRLRVPHRGIDVIEPTERFSAANWVALAQRAVGEAHAAGRIPVIVGGSGFYVGAFFQPLFAEPALDDERRSHIRDELATMDTAQLRRWCTALDPARAHLGRAQLLRAIEIALLTGERLSEMHVARSRPSAYAGGYLLVDPGPTLASRIAQRVDAMLAAGWCDEVRELMDSVPADAPAWHATGYHVLRRHLEGELDRDTARERIMIDTRQYAKRQRTWFRHQLPRGQVQRLAPVADELWQDVATRWMSGFVAPAGHAGAGA